MIDSLLPHQHVGANFLAYRRYAMLCDEPGAGKTAQVVEAVRLTGARNILVVCPVSVRTHWQREFERWSGRTDITVVNGVPTSINPGITVTSHAALARKETVQMLNQVGFDIVIVDEAHDVVRTVTTARCVYLLGATPVALRHHVDRIWLLTGSPMVNSAADLYAVCSALFSNGQVIDYDAFTQRYTNLVPDSFSQNLRPTGLINEEELKTWLRPHMLRRADFLNLPPRTIKPLPLRVDDAAVAAVLSEGFNMEPGRLERSIELNLDPDEAMSSVRRALGTAKAPIAADYIAETVFSGSGPVVAFYHHKDTRETLFSILKSYGLRVSWIDGSVTGASRTAVVDWFQEGRLDVALIQTQAGGTGITLTRSNQGVVVEQPWTSIALDQAAARLHRITQLRPVQIDVLTSQCWLDEVISRVLVNKANAVKRLLVN